ncbi:hypothetical protein [Dokdonella sp.]|uniref:hypothetical protein n=1 Tax=Dokdonella sp. TaxID=2291710 RepID=UPI001B0223CC|nr:hypothetical protein [Dokdonella sp.]MBO9663748.1 hypothetical protein [Dokdonella sp.]
MLARSESKPDYGVRPGRFLSIAVVSLACVGAYWLGRVDSPARQVAASESAPEDVTVPAPVQLARAQKSSRILAVSDVSLPPPGTRLKDMYAQLQARANSGDSAAATQLYRELNRCELVSAIESTNAQNVDGLMDENVGSMDQAQLLTYQAQLDAIENNRQVMQRMREFCGGLSGDMRNSLVENLQRAAQLGDEEARACYLQRGPNFDMRSFANHPALLDEYRGSVSSMVRSGLEAGDWKVVDVVRGALQPGSKSLLEGVLGSDLSQYYRFLKLYRLGAEPYRTESLDRQLTAAAQGLTSAEIAEADSWAQKIFEENFKGSTSTESTILGWDPCSFAYE